MLLKQCDELTKVLKKLPTSLALYQEAIQLIKKSILDRNKILICGNGGSHAQAQHLAAELMVRYKKGGRSEPIAAIALGSDNSIVSASSNDLGFSSGLAREIQALGRSGDLLIALSTSGESPNINRAICQAHEIGIKTIGLCGFRGMLEPCNIELRVPSIDTARIQESHMLIIHSICEELE